MSTTDRNGPRDGWLADRCIAYFRRLPDEELSVKDIALKFGADVNTVHQLLKAAVEACSLKRDGTVYSAGAEIGTAETGAKLTDPPPPKPRTRSVTRSELPSPDQVKIDDNVPLPTGRGSRIDWEPLLERLKVNQSCVLPLSARHTLSNAIAARHKADNGKFTLRKLDQKELRVWRIA